MRIRRSLAYADLHRRHWTRAAAPGRLALPMACSPPASPRRISFATRETMMEEGAERLPEGCRRISISAAVIVGSIGEDPKTAREGAREMAAMYLANKVQNIRGSADTLLRMRGLNLRRNSAHRRRHGIRRTQSRSESRDGFGARKSLPHCRDAGSMHRAHSKNIATRAARTSCSNFGATIVRSKRNFSARKCCRISRKNNRGRESIRSTEPLTFRRLA